MRRFSNSSKEVSHGMVQCYSETILQRFPLRCIILMHRHLGEYVKDWAVSGIDVA